MIGKVNLRWPPTATAREPTARERAALACLAAAAAFCLALSAITLREQAKAYARQAQFMRGDLQSLVSKGDSRAIKQVQVEKQNASRLAIIAATRELAAFQAHTLLSGYASQAGIENIRIDDDHTGGPATPAGSVTMSVDGIYEKKRLSAFLNGLSRDPHWIGIESVNVREGERPRFELDVRFLYLTSDGD